MFSLNIPKPKKYRVVYYVGKRKMETLANEVDKALAYGIRKSAIGTGRYLLGTIQVEPV